MEQNQTIRNFARLYFSDKHSWNENGNNFMKRIYTSFRPWELADIGNSSKYPSESAEQLVDDIKTLCKDESCDVQLAEDADIEEYKLELALPRGSLQIEYKEPSGKGLASIHTGVARMTAEPKEGYLKKEDAQKLADLCKGNFFSSCPDTETAANKIRTAIKMLGGDLDE